MTKYQKLNIANMIAIILMIVIGFIFKGMLPDLMPTHFDSTGVAIKFAPTIVTVFFLPIIGAITVFLFLALVKKNASFWTKEHNKEAVAQTNLGILVLIASLYIGNFLNALNYSQYFQYSYFAIGFGLFFLISAIPMKIIEKNLLYGIRLPWTLKSDHNWKKTHALTSILMLITGVLLVVIGFFTKNHTVILTLVTITFMVPTVYSFKLRNI